MQRLLLPATVHRPRGQSHFRGRRGVVQLRETRVGRENRDSPRERLLIPVLWMAILSGGILGVSPTTNIRAEVDMEALSAPPPPTPLPATWLPAPSRRVLVVAPPARVFLGANRVVSGEFPAVGPTRMSDQGSPPETAQRSNVAGALRVDDRSFKTITGFAVASDHEETEAAPLPPTLKHSRRDGPTARRGGESPHTSTSPRTE